MVRKDSLVGFLGRKPVAGLTLQDGRILECRTGDFSRLYNYWNPVDRTHLWQSSPEGLGFRYLSF
jgi:hypothetical protein